MILEILDAIRSGVVEVIKSAIDTSVVVVKSLVKAFLIFKNGVNTASPIEIFLVLCIFVFIGFITFKFLVGSAKEFAKYPKPWERKHRSLSPTIFRSGTTSRLFFHWETAG